MPFAQTTKKVKSAYANRIAFTPGVFLRILSCVTLLITTTLFDQDLIKIRWSLRTRLIITITRSGVDAFL